MTHISNGANDHSKTVILIVLREKMREKPTYQCFAVLDPKPGLVSGGQVKAMRVYPDRVQVARDSFPFASIRSRELVDGCIHVSTEDRNLSFGIQGFDSKGKISPSMTQTVSKLLDALCQNDEQGVRLALDHLAEFRRAYRIRNAIAVLICLAAGLTFGVVMVLPGAVVGIGKLFDRTSGGDLIRLYIWLGIGLVVLVNAITIGILKLRKRRTKGSIVPLEGAPSGDQ